MIKINHMHQTGPRKGKVYDVLPSVAYVLDAYQVCHDVNIG